MATAEKPKIKNYGLDFKLRAVQLSHQPGIQGAVLVHRSRS